MLILSCLEKNYKANKSKGKKICKLNCICIGAIAIKVTNLIVILVRKPSLEWSFSKPLAIKFKNDLKSIFV